MTFAKLIAVTALVAGGLGLGAAAQAAPLSVAPLAALAGGAVAEPVAYGCGPGWIPNRFGYCRPMARPYGYGYHGARWGSPHWGGPHFGFYRPRPVYRPYSFY